MENPPALFPAWPGEAEVAVALTFDGRPPRLPAPRHRRPGRRGAVRGAWAGA